MTPMFFDVDAFTLGEQSFGDLVITNQHQDFIDALQFIVADEDTFALLAQKALKELSTALVAPDKTNIDQIIALDAFVAVVDAYEHTNLPFDLVLPFIASVEDEFITVYQPQVIHQVKIMTNEHCKNCGRTQTCACGHYEPCDGKNHKHFGPDQSYFISSCCIGSARNILVWLNSNISLESIKQLN